MKPKFLYSVIVCIVFVLAAGGCKRVPAPVVNPPAVETSLASTALALAKQTEAASPYTATPPATSTATFTPTPKISVNGTSLEIQNDESALFTDHKAGIQLVIPPGWMPLRVNEDEYYKAFTSDIVTSNPAFSSRLTEIQDANLDNFRLDAIDIREDHTVNGILSDISVKFYSGDTRTLEQWAQAEGKKKSAFKNYLFLNRGYPELANGTRVLMIDRTWTQDQTKKLFMRSVFFPLSTGTLVLEFYSNKDLKDTLLPDFDQVVNSVSQLNP